MYNNEKERKTGLKPELLEHGHCDSIHYMRVGHYLDI